MSKTHTVEVVIQSTEGVEESIQGEMSFQNGKKQMYVPTALGLELSVDARDEFAHLLKRVNEFNKRLDGKIIKFEVRAK